MLWQSVLACAAQRFRRCRMAETPAVGLQAWRDDQAERSSTRRDFADHWLGLWGSAVLIAMLLYMLIGQQPYNHEAVLDPVTGVAPVSPINRIFWLGLFGLSVPIFWFRRTLLVETVRRLWPLIVLLIWFAATTRWALDPGVSSKRLFLYVVQTAICVAVSLSIRNGHRMHTAMAIACAIMVGIDLFSWVFLHGRSITPLGLAAIHTHKNTLGAVMLFCGIVFGTYLVSQKTALGRGFWIGVLLAGFALLVASRSKTSLAIYVVAAMFAPLLIVYLRSRSLTMLAVAVTGSAMLGLSVLAWVAWCAVQGLDPLGPLSHLTFTMRTDVWKFSLNQWAQRPWTGLGFGSFWDIDPGVQPSLQTDEWFAKPDAYTNESHNGYIDLAVTTGADRIDRRDGGLGPLDLPIPGHDQVFAVGELPGGSPSPALRHLSRTFSPVVLRPQFYGEQLFYRQCHLRNPHSADRRRRGFALARAWSGGRDQLAADRARAIACQSITAIIVTSTIWPIAVPAIAPPKP